jgi:cytidylate kinase
VIVAIDGPAAAGKGTLARALAARFGYAYLDTGTLYRAVAVRLRRAGILPDHASAVAAARAVTAGDRADPMLRDEESGHLASKVAAIAAVRTALLDYQRQFARHPPGDARGAVLDGRDIGTIVCPDADVKIFVTASIEARAERRVLELKARGAAVDAVAIRTDMEARDARDAGRAAAPLRPAPDADLLDTTKLDIDSAFAAAESFILQRVERASRP